MGRDHQLSLLFAALLVAFLSITIPIVGQPTKVEKSDRSSMVNDEKFAHLHHGILGSLGFPLSLPFPGAFPGFPGGLWGGFPPGWWGGFPGGPGPFPPGWWGGYPGGPGPFPGGSGGFAGSPGKTKVDEIDESRRNPSP